jgi:putative ABC transport system permease protein
MLALLWLKGLLARRSGRIAGAAVGVTLTVAFLAILGALIASSTASMTRRAIAGVPVDWQVQVGPGADVQTVAIALGKAAPSSAIAPVGYADAAGFTADTHGTVQTTGPGKVLGLPPRYRTRFPAELRPLLGSVSGVLVAQQTAANLHVAVGDIVTINRIGLPAVGVQVDGIVDLPYADSLFQAVGVPAGVAPQAPPDNVVVLPLAEWHRLFDPQAAIRPGSVRTELHVRLGGDLPPDPGAAYSTVVRQAHHLEALIAGSGVVGNNLAARLSGARADALYAQVLFVFLGLPGAVLAVLLTIAVAASGADRRRREQALLRTRGASTHQLLHLAALEALGVGIVGAALGVVLAGVAKRMLFAADLTASGSAAQWAIGAALFGVLLAVGAELYPAWAQARHSTVAAARPAITRPGTPLWQRVYLDLILLTASGAAFWLTARSGYQVVLAPEGVPQASVSYQAFFAPVCLWIGAGLAATRVWRWGLARGRRGLANLLRPLARGLSGVVAASLSRQRVLVAAGIVLVALAFAFATSTAVFNTTYDAQSRVDAELTNGADVAVTGPTAFPPNSRLAALQAVPGVVAAQPMQHRFAYVGTDLQDLYGIDPRRIHEATTMANPYFASRNARGTLAALAARADGVLVSAETAATYQLKPGDLVNLRLQDARDHHYHVVPFTFVDIVREFPTAPKDSFLVANARYIAQQTGINAAEIVLLRTSGNPAAVAARVREAVRPLPGVTVTDIGTTQRAISSTLTAVDLHGLTRLELSFAGLLVAGATGLILVLGLAERRRTFSILTALGAGRAQLGAFLWSEALLILGGGAVIGIGLGFGMAEMLVKILTGVFDPPPLALAVPWAYLGLLAATSSAAMAAAVLVTQAASHRHPLIALRDM